MISAVQQRPPEEGQPPRAAMLPREEREKVVQRLLAQRSPASGGAGSAPRPGSAARAQRLLKERQSCGPQTPKCENAACMRKHSKHCKELSGPAE